MAPSALDYRTPESPLSYLNYPYNSSCQPRKPKEFYRIFCRSFCRSRGLPIIIRNLLFLLDKYQAPFTTNLPLAQVILPIFLPILSDQEVDKPYKIW